MWRDGNDVGKREATPEVFLDGVQVVPPVERRSFAGIRAWLEARALEARRVVSVLRVDGEPLPANGLEVVPASFHRIEAETMGLEEMPLQVLETALEQTHRLLSRAEAALAQMCINNAVGAREIWWRLAADLKLPLVTLSLLPERACAAGPTSPLQLRRWQLEQLAEIIRELDRQAETGTPQALIEAFEKRLWPWLGRLRETLLLQRETFAAGARLAAVA